MEKIYEICCGSYEDALAAYRGGAKRIELNSALYLGGLTPTLAELILTKRNTKLKVISMIRPRGAGFCYSEAEFETMKLDAEVMLQNGADGIAFGCLTKEQKIDEEKTKILTEIIKKYHGEAVFHRAFDCTENPYEAAEKLIELGIDRILTSGGKEKAVEGMQLIADLQRKYGDQIEILAGSGINASNAESLMKQTGVFQVHSSCKEWKYDPTTTGMGVSYSYALGVHKNDHDAVSEEEVKKLIM